MGALVSAFWLLKSEPDVYGLDELERAGEGVWEGVRNYQARNFMRAMRTGDLFLFYHSNAKPSGVAGVGRIVREAYPDPFQFDPKSKYYDPASLASDPRWSAVNVGFVERFPRVISLEELKAHPGLVGMAVVQKGTRLSVTPVSAEHFERVVAMGRFGG